MVATVQDALRPWMRRLQLRSTLSDAEVEGLLQLPGNLFDYQPNRDFVRLGERVHAACVVVSGLAGRFDQTASGARQITALHIPGDACDLHSVPVENSSTALQALTRTTVLHVPHEALRALAAEFPALAMAFWRDCVVDAAILSKWTLNIGRASTRQRVAHLLCELALRYRAIGEDIGDFSFPATQTHIGDLTGITNVHINRTLRGLADEGLAIVRGGRIVITDWRGLAAEADFDPLYLHLPGDLGLMPAAG